jgi:hypothetical protein
MLGWKVIEGKQDFLILLQALAGFGEFDLVTGDELIVSCQSCFASRRQVHLMDQLLRFALHALGHFIQDVNRLMHPATLLSDGAIFFLQSDPEAKRTVTDGQLRRSGQSLAFELPKQFPPGLTAFAITVDHSQQFFGAILGGSDQDQHTGSFQSRVGR